MSWHVWPDSHSGVEKSHATKTSATALSKRIYKECSNMCSSKDPSCLRSTKAQDVKKFKFSKVEGELQKRAPLLSAVLWTASLRKSKRADEDPFWKPSVCMAAAVLLKNRSPCMTLLQLINTIIIYHSGIMVSVYYLKVILSVILKVFFTFSCFFLIIFMRLVYNLIIQKSDFQHTWCTWIRF